MAGNTKRLRDPVHGLIVFDLADEVDRAAWKLIDTPEFQRLRRVKQLGFSELDSPVPLITGFRILSAFFTSQGSL